MLVVLDLSDALVAAQLLALQRCAYQSEADLVHYQGLPVLHESLPTLMDSGESVYGWREDDELIGAIGYTTSMFEVHICRLAVSPDHRRRGVAAKLAQAVIVEAGPRPISVSTAAANAPGLALYHHLGFCQRSESVTADGLKLVHLQRWAERTKIAMS